MWNWPKWIKIDNSHILFSLHSAISTSLRASPFFTKFVHVFFSVMQYEKKYSQISYRTHEPRRYLIERFKEERKSHSSEIGDSTMLKMIFCHSFGHFWGLKKKDEKWSELISVFNEEEPNRNRKSKKVLFFTPNLAAANVWIDPEHLNFNRIKRRYLLPISNDR